MNIDMNEFHSSCESDVHNNWELGKCNRQSQKKLKLMHVAHIIIFFIHKFSWCATCVNQKNLVTYINLFTLQIVDITYHAYVHVKGA